MIIMDILQFTLQKLLLLSDHAVTSGCLHDCHTPLFYKYIRLTAGFTAKKIQTKMSFEIAEQDCLFNT